MLGLRQEPPASHSPQPTEEVIRPEPGLARGKWEAPAWAFWVALTVALLLVGIWVAVRRGMLRRFFAKAPPPDAGPNSRRGARP
jgi:hypothetical protein